MRREDDLRRILHRIDGRGYKAYRETEGAYDLGRFVLIVDHAQGDPFASPSRVRAVVDLKSTGFKPHLWSSKPRAVAFRDFLARQFERAIRRFVKGNRGIGNSGLVHVDAGGQEVLERSAVVVIGGRLEVRFVVGLPAAGRTVLGREAAEMLLEEVPKVVQASLFAENVNLAELEAQVALVEDQEYLRRRLLPEKGLVAFVGEGAILPRRSGVDDRPLENGAVPFDVPLELAVEAELPNAGRVRGMGIPAGVTLVVGGGFHGKSTLLRALERGVYNHVSGDGREWVITDPSAMKIRAEDGRYVCNVDISPFIANLPGRKDTRGFSTENASGSTSQAANILESVEAGARVLLLDEDTSATNFMIRDQRMQALVAKEKEPITPFVDKVRRLYEEHGVSTVLVMGGCGDYFEVANTVIMMDEYRPLCVTEKARDVARRFPTQRHDEGGDSFGRIRERVPDALSFDARRGKRDVKIEAKGLYTVVFGTTTIDLSALEQIVDMSQTRAIGHMIYRFAKDYAAPDRPLRRSLEMLDDEIEQRGLDCLVPHPVGNLARARSLEAAGAINRMRTLRVRQVAFR